MDAIFQKRKLITEHNLDIVEFCTDNCVNSKYNSFDLSKPQKECLTNCYTKVSKLGGFVNFELKSLIEKK